MTIPLVARPCSTSDASVSFAVKDVSLGGAYLVTPQRWYPGTIVTMSFRYDSAYVQVARIQGNESASVQMRAKVLRAGPDGVGVKFVYLNKQERFRFERFLDGAQVREMK